MSQIGFGGGAGFVDNFAKLAAAELFYKTQRQFDDMFHSLQAQISSDTKRSFVGTHKPSYVDQRRKNSKQYRHPAVMRQILRLAKVRRNFQYFLNDFPDIVERR